MASRIHKSWKVLATLCGLASSAIGISINTSGVFYSPVSEDLGFLRGSFSLHMTIFSLVTALSAFLVPLIIRKIPFKFFLSLSVGVTVVATGMMGLSNQLWHFYALGAIRGFASSLFSIITITLVINQWFLAKNGLATSISLGFSGLIGATFSPLFSQMIQQVGWRETYFIKAGIILLFCLPAILYPYAMSPEDEGTKAYGNLPGGQKSANLDMGTKLGPALYCLLFFVSSIAFVSSMTQHLPGYGESLGLASSLGASLLSMSMLGNILSKLLVGALSDLIGPIKATFVLLGLNLLGVLFLLQGSANGLLLVGAGLFGSAFGIGSVSSALLTRELFGDNLYIKVFPIVSFAGSLGAALAFSALGYIYDFAKSYTPALYLITGLILLSSFSLSIAFYFSKKNSKGDSYEY